MLVKDLKLRKGTFLFAAACESFNCVEVPGELPLQVVWQTVWQAKEFNHGFLIHSYETIRAEAKEHESSIKLNSDALDALIRIQAKYEIQCRLCL